MALEYGDMRENDMRKEGAVKPTLERVKKKTRHPFKGLVTVLLAVLGYLAFLAVVAFLVNWVMS